MYKKKVSIYEYPYGCGIVRALGERANEYPERNLDRFHNVVSHSYVKNG
jgi:hypothetical protein